MDDPFRGLTPDQKASIISARNAMTPEQEAEARRRWEAMTPWERGELGRILDRIRTQNIQLAAARRDLNATRFQIALAFPTAVFSTIPIFATVPPWWPLTYMVFQVGLVLIAVQHRRYLAASLWGGGFVIGALFLFGLLAA